MLNNLNTLERILNKKDKLYYNVKWDNDDYYDSGVFVGYNKAKEEMKSLWDIPTQIYL